ncbi:MAG: indole-3-glycerol phosphate synthase TrpC [Kiritimatiellales bacterium]|nr:indole-3-glycerol phosphate synthase TrpC [Kiritimatiellales bacterium]
MNILEQIIADKRVEIAARKRFQSLEELKAKAPGIGKLFPMPGKAPDFVAALRSAPIGLIAEVKRRSPSVGKIREPFDPAEIGRDYEANGAQAISCLMDEKYFGGGADDFRAVREAVALPMLYKEFVIDPWQVYHARALGASAVLLIVGALSDAELVAFMAEIRSAGLQPLVEVHNREEMERAICTGADCIGINNRDLKTFVTTLDTTVELCKTVPPGCTVISESGIKSPEDVARLRDAGVHAILVGESLLRMDSPGAAAKRLMGLS